MADSPAHGVIRSEPLVAVGAPPRGAARVGAPCSYRTKKIRARFRFRFRFRFPDDAAHGAVARAPATTFTPRRSSRAAALLLPSRRARQNARRVRREQVNLGARAVFLQALRHHPRQLAPGVAPADDRDAWDVS